MNNLQRIYEEPRSRKRTDLEAMDDQMNEYRNVVNSLGDHDKRENCPHYIFFNILWHILGVDPDCSMLGYQLCKINFDEEDEDT